MHLTGACTSIALQAAWELLQQGHASRILPTGSAPESAVFVGIQQMEYGALAAPHLHSIGPYSGECCSFHHCYMQAAARHVLWFTTHTRASSPAPPAATGGAFSVAAGRLSFCFGFKGPAVSIDTACSSALVAAHQGTLHLSSKPQHPVLTAGINLMLAETTSAAAQAAGMLTLDGRCKTLDASADGYVRAEACTVFLLSLASSVTDPDASILYLAGTCVNQDGRSSSLTAPNGPSQQSVIRGALQAAGLLPSQIGGLEMHGTGRHWGGQSGAACAMCRLLMPTPGSFRVAGTARGDPIEVGAALAVLPGNTLPLRLGAAKSHIGHAEPAAGGIGAVQSADLLQLNHGRPIVGLRTINPHVSSIFATLQSSRSPYVPRQEAGAISSSSSNSMNCQQVVGISSFAFQGTNAHISVTKHSSGNALSVGAPPFSWHRKRYWFATCAHQMLKSFLMGNSAAHVFCSTKDLSLSFVNDHQVCPAFIAPT